MKNMVLLIDTNVLLDDMVNREPFVEESRQILHLCAEKESETYR